MQLTKLTLNGFKSFADCTEFEFHDATTGIVGPNGCGKSNVVDAIKWVLGERSSKSLRGKEMIDVIFAGSAGRKPAGMASVKLTFDNPVISHEAEPQADQAETVDSTTSENIAASVDALDAERESDVDESSNEEDLLADDHAPSMIQPHVRKKRTLPIDADVVEVERQLYRDGTSRYLINNKRARLKDIRELFMDTGVGADAYSIIEQGKVDAMLLASPMERRTIFEEAAGIARYKQRRIESQRKLERANANLALAREQLANTERRLRIVKGQAAKARRFKELDSEYGAWRMALAFEQYDDLRQRLAGLTSRLADLQATREQAAALLTQAEHDKQEAELARADAIDHQRRLEAELAGATHTIEQARQRQAMASRSMEQLAARHESDIRQLATLKTRADELDATASQLAQQVADLAEQVTEAQRQLDKATEERGQIVEQLAAVQAQLAQRRASVTNINRQRTSLIASIAGDERRLEAVREQLDNLKARRDGLGEDVQTHEAECVELEAQIASRQEQIATLEEALSSRQQLASSMSEDRRQLAAQLSELEQEAVRIDSRLQTLDEMRKARVGLDDAARAILERKAAGQGFEPVLGTLSDLIEADESAALIVERALGQALQALVVEQIDDLPEQEELDALPGRVLFLPLAQVGSPDRAESINTEALFGQRVTPVRSLVSARRDLADDPDSLARQIDLERIETLLDRLLGQTYLVADMDAALLLASSPLAGRTIITRGGAVLWPNSRIELGPSANATSQPLPDEANALHADAKAHTEPMGILQQRSQMHRLKSQLESLNQQLHRSRKHLAGVDAQAAALNDETTELRQQLASHQRQLAAQQARHERLISESQRLAEQTRSIETEIEQLTERMTRFAADRDALRERAAKLERLEQEEETHALEAQKTLETIQAQRDAITDQLNAARVDLSRLNEQAAAARREANRATIDRDQVERAIRDLTTQLENAADQQRAYEQEIAQAQEQIEEATRAQRRAREELQTINEELARCDELVKDLGQRVIDARAHAQHIERDWHSLEVSRREVEVKRENLESRTLEDLSLDLDLEYDEYQMVMADGTIERIDPVEAAHTIDTLRQDIRKLGHVNLDAIEEETQLADRNEELIAQVADIDNAREQLTELIDKLNEVCRQRFGEAFARIQHEFGDRNGMFRKLFGGGRAEVRLMPLIKTIETPDGPRKVETDQTDLLESGIEIIAKPPGKEPRSISQLSGGEKTLTAVALLLSIFRSKPSCFCILDEVDAALDEANVGRYVNVVCEYADRSHFIVITHNKRTMQKMDRLYGITMQERGVSTRVTVKLDRQNDASDPVPMVHGTDTASPEDNTPQTRNGKTTQNRAAAKPGSLKAALASLREEHTEVSVNP